MNHFFTIRRKKPFCQILHRCKKLGVTPSTFYFLAKMFFVGFGKDSLLAELQTRSPEGRSHYIALKQVKTALFLVIRECFES